MKCYNRFISIYFIYSKLKMVFGIVPKLQNSVLRAYPWPGFA